jgi:CYTH domain-containing protein
MTEPADADATGLLRQSKYARVERERRFLLTGSPPASSAVTVRTISDRYLVGTRLRLRRMEDVDTGECVYKLTQKVPAHRRGRRQGLITNTYLSRAEYDLLATLPAAVLTKIRLSVPPMGIDVFEGPLAGLVMAEAEFCSDGAAEAFVPPTYCIFEVTNDDRFTGGRLASTGQSELRACLASITGETFPSPVEGAT